MKELIEAFQIFAKYIGDKKYPIHCAHEVMYVACDPEKVSEEDIKKLDEMGFLNGNDKDAGSEYEGGFYSYKYGSC